MKLKIGTLFPAMEDLAPMGQPITATIPLLVEQVNGCGGVKGQPVELVSADDETNPTKGNLAMTIRRLMDILHFSFSIHDLLRTTSEH